MSAGALALLAAVLFALGAVLQQCGAMQAPSALSRAFLGTIVNDPVWLAGAAAQATGWVAQGFALDRGQLFLVQPIVSLQVVIALPFGIVFTGQRVGRTEWLGAGAVVAALAAFLAVSNPTAGRTDAPGETWLLAGAAIAASAGLLAVVGYRLHPRARAALFGTAAGIVFGFQAAVTKVFVDAVHRGLLSILTSWSTYALVLSALGGFYLAQISLQAGVLAPAIATTNVANPVTSSLLARLVFEETPQRGIGGKAISLAALATLAAGLLAISRGEARRSCTRESSPGDASPSRRS